MNTDANPESHDGEVRWDEARAFLQRVVRRHLGRADQALVEELTQEALVRLLRAVRREGARNLEGLMTVIARRTVVDHIRSIERWRRLVRPIEEGDPDPVDPNPGPDQPIGDPDQRTRFAVLEYFHARNPGCHALALAYFQEEDWGSVAARGGESSAAVVKRWSRCVEVLRRAARSGGGPLWEWA